MPSRQAVITHSVLRTLVRPVVSYMPVPVLRRFTEKSLRNAEPPRNVRIELVSAGGVAAEIITPDKLATDRVLYYLHGGGYVFGGLRTHRRFVASMAKRLGARALHIDYRLAPEHPHPAALEDALAAYDWLVAQGVAADDIVIGGESAGGGLTMATLLSLRERGAPLPGLGFLISPWLDLTMSGRSIRTRRRADPMIPANYLHTVSRMYRGAHHAQSPLVSPLFAELRGLPPLLIHVGGNEVLLDDAVRFAENCETAGVNATLRVYDDLFHAFHLFGHLPEARSAVREIVEHITGHWDARRPV
jgi:acetyl esterase/lipase